MKNFFNNKWFIIPTLFLVFGAVAVIATTIGDSGFSGIQVDNYFSGSGRQGINQNVSFEDADGNEHLLEFEDGLLVNYSLDEPLPDFPSEGLVSYWKLDELSGNVFDSQGTNNLNAYGSIVYGESGIINDALRATGSISDRLEDNSFNSIDSDTNSISFWFKGFSEDSMEFVSTNNYSDFGMNLFFSSGVIYARATETGYAPNANISWSFDNSTWHHVVAIYDDPSIKIYLDGLEGTNGLWDGRDFEGSSFKIFSGDTSRLGIFSIDEVGIWNRSLTESEIQALYNNGNGLPYPN